MSVFEPFAGAGTTNIVAKSMGIDSTGIEINPFLAFVGQTAIDWSPDPDAFVEAGRIVVDEARQTVVDGPDDPQEFADHLGIELPPIHNVSRWWRDQVLRELLAVRQAIAGRDTSLVDHLRLALAQIVYSTANITMGRLQVAFVDRTEQRIEVFGPFAASIARIADDLRNADLAAAGHASIVKGDSTEPHFVTDRSMDALFTSPPYPNRYSYVWNTRPHLYLLEFFTTAKEAATLDLSTIGGTWGGATSSLQKGTVRPRTNIEMIAGGLIQRLHAESTLMGNYVTKYFNALDVQVGAVLPKLRPGAPIGYVVGNSESKGIMIETHEILAEIFRAHGLTEISWDVLRKRNSGAGLTEVTVNARV
jgi:hypothetical protein